MKFVSIGTWNMASGLLYLVVLAIATFSLTTKADEITKTASAEQFQNKENSTMTTETNKLVMQRFLTFINTASEKLAVELVSPNAVFHVPGRSEPVRGPAGYLEIIAMMRGGFPDIQWKLEEMIVEGDKVAARFTMRGTHQGSFFGVPATGKKIEVQAMNIYRFADGKIVEERGQPDLLSLMQQIGAIPK